MDSTKVGTVEQLKFNRRPWKRNIQARSFPCGYTRALTPNGHFGTWGNRRKQQQLLEGAGLVQTWVTRVAEGESVFQKH